ncbi:hypothetical protein [Kutzneria sp. NPDC051319]|uniref:DUF7878 domain-containing protein n=1 Tax=Kutzneria sp. NPDC051319 TaxID=3155047 RepID=UPI00342DD153
MLEIHCGDIIADDLSLDADGRSRSRAEVNVHVEADLAIVQDGRELYAEILFPVVELSAALKAWQHNRGTFEYESMSLAERWAVRFVPAEGGWRVVNDEDPQRVIRGGVLATHEMDAAVDEFRERVRKSTVDLLGEWITEYLE